MKPFWKWVIGIFVVLIIAAAAGIWYLGNHWKPLLSAKLDETIANSTDSLYSISYDKIDLNVVTGNASLINFRLIPDTNVYQRLKMAKQAPDNMYDIRVASLDINNFHPRRLLTGKRLNVDEVVVHRPSVTIINDYQPYNDTTKLKDSRTLYQRISKALNEINVGAVMLDGINFTFIKKQDTIEQKTVFTDIDLTVTDILIDSASQFDSTRFFNTRNIELNLNKYRFNTADSLYYVGFDNLKLATGDRSLKISGIKYAPRFRKSEFHKHINRAKDMVVLAFDTLTLERIDLLKLMDQQKIHAGKMTIDSGTVDVFNNLTFPKKITSKIGKSPHQQLLKLKASIKIDTLALKKVDISYAEVGKKTGEEGKITFNRSSGFLYNVTNDSLALLGNHMMRADLTSYVMDRGKLNVHFSFNMTDPKGGFTYKGNMGPVDGRLFNRIIKPLLPAEIKSANVKGVRFDMEGDDYRNRGTVHVDYNNLKINIFERLEDGSVAKKGFISTLANTFIINDSNPDANGLYHTGHVNYKRPPEYSFFKTLWQSLLQGIKECAGVSKEREAKLTKTAKDAGKGAKKVSKFFKGIFKKKDNEEKK